MEEAILQLDALNTFVETFFQKKARRWREGSLIRLFLSGSSTTSLTTRKLSPELICNFNLSIKESDFTFKAILLGSFQTIIA